MLLVPLMLFTSSPKVVNADTGFFYNLFTSIFGVTWVNQINNWLSNKSITNQIFTLLTVAIGSSSGPWSLAPLKFEEKTLRLNTYFNLNVSASSNVCLFGIPFDDINQLRSATGYKVLCDNEFVDILFNFTSDNYLYFVCDSQNIEQGTNIQFVIDYATTSNQGIKILNQNIIFKEFNFVVNDYNQVTQMQSQAIDIASAQNIDNNTKLTKEAVDLLNNRVSNLSTILERIEASNLDSSDIAALESLLSQISTKLNTLNTEVNINTDLTNVETSLSEVQSNIDSLVDLASNIHYDNSLTFTSVNPAWSTTDSNNFDINAQQSLKAGFVVVNVPTYGQLGNTNLKFKFNVYRHSGGYEYQSYNLIPFNYQRGYVSCIGYLSYFPNLDYYTYRVSVEGRASYSSNSCSCNFVYYDNSSFSNLMGLFDYLTDVNYSSSLSSINSNISSINSNLDSIENLLNSTIDISSSVTNSISEVNSLTSSLDSAESGIFTAFTQNLHALNFHTFGNNLINTFDWVSLQFENLIDDQPVNDLVKFSLSIGTALLLLGVIF